MTETEAKYQHLLRIMAMEEERARAQRVKRQPKPLVAVAA
jgi:hypothetical protein